MTSTALRTPTLTPRASSSATPTPPPPQPTPSATPIIDVCGDARRGDSEECDGSDDAECPGRCRSDCECAIVFELPLVGWSSLGDASARLTDDAGTNAPALLIDTAWNKAEAKGVVVKTSGNASDRIVYPAEPTLGLPLPQLAFTVRTHEFFEVEVVVRSGSGTPRVLAYRAVDAVTASNGPAPSVASSNGLGAVFAIGADMAAGELGTTYRDLAADLRAAFGLRFASVEQVRVRGSLELLRIALASDRARDEDTEARLSLPVAGWDKHGTGKIYENRYDAALPGPTLRSAASGLELTYPEEDRLLVRFRTIAFAVRGTTDFAVEVKVVTREGANVELTYEADRKNVKIRSDGALLPLVTSPRAAGRYRNVRLDLAQDLATADPRASLATIASVTLRGRFTAGDIQLRDRSE